MFPVIIHFPAAGDPADGVDVVISSKAYPFMEIKVYMSSAPTLIIGLKSYPNTV